MMGCLLHSMRCHQRALNAPVHIVTGIRKFDRGLSQILHGELHWLDVPDRVFFKLAVIVHRCLNGRAPLYLSDYCVPAAGADTRRQLRSSNRQLLAVPRYQLNTYGWLPGLFSCRPHSLEFSPGLYPGTDINADGFRRLLNTYLFARYRVRGSLTIIALYKSSYLLKRLDASGYHLVRPKRHCVR